VNILGALGLGLAVWGLRAEHRAQSQRVVQAVLIACVLSGAVLSASEVPGINWCENWWPDHGWQYVACCLWYGC
jgi:hypothetical protein